MEEKINEVENYFKNKLLNGEYEVVKQTEHVLTVSIDNLYIFNIWIANMQYPESRDLYSGAYNYMHFELTKKEKTKLHNMLKDEVIRYNKDILLAKKLEELEILKKELNIKD